MTSVVKKILRGRQRIETDRIIAFRSPWRYQIEYCNPASGHEKGGVEGELGWFRRNCLVPIPEATNLAEFNEDLLRLCGQNRQRTVSGHDRSGEAATQYERPLLTPLAPEGYPIEEILDSLVVGSQSRVKAKGNWYSAPVRPGLRVTALVGPLTVSIQHGDRVVAEHPRAEGQGRQSRNLEHYLAVLKRKPGAIGLNATGAVACRGALADVSGHALATVGRTARQEHGDARHDYAGPGGPRCRLVAADRHRRRSSPPGRVG